MLHTTPPAITNKLPNTANLSENSNNIPTLFANLINGCCQEKVDNNVKQPDGAKVILSLDKKKIMRRRAVVKIDRVDSSDKDVKGSFEVTTASVNVGSVRRKTGETGSSAPLLNYIYDTSNTHQHTHRNDR